MSNYTKNAKLETDSNVLSLMQMAMTLDPNEILDRARSRLLGRPTQQAANNLETYLTDVFYGRTNAKTKQLGEALDKGAQKYFEETLGTIVDSYDFGTNELASSRSGAAGKIGVNDKRTSKTHSKYIQLATVKERLAMAESKLKEMMKSKNPIQEYGNVYLDMQKLISTANALLAQEDTLIDGKFYVSDHKSLIDELDAIYQRVTYSLDLTSIQDIGEVFERALQALSENGAEKVTEDMILSTFKQQTAGAELADRGRAVADINFNAGINIEPIETNNPANIHYKVTGSNGASYKITGVFSKKQGKMDVMINLPNISKAPFRVSAKNWSKLSKHDFGSTSIAAAILRSDTVQAAISAGLHHVVTNKGGVRANVRNYIKACALVDIVMGYSQADNYADTLIINDRQNKRIRVYSLYSLFSKNSNQLFANVKGYSDNDIRSAIINKGYNVKRSVSSQQNYISYVLGGMANVKAMVSAGILK